MPHISKEIDKAFLAVAKEKAVLIITRPVTRGDLLLSNPSKGLKVKGKSSTAPLIQGYIPIDQRLAKTDSNEPSWIEASKKVLQVIGKQNTPDSDSKIEAVCVSNVICTYDPKGSVTISEEKKNTKNIQKSEKESLAFLRKLIDSNGKNPTKKARIISCLVLGCNGKALVADVDLLAIGILKESVEKIRGDGKLKLAKLHGGFRGSRTVLEDEIITALNKAIYGAEDSRRCVHHGPECHNTKYTTSSPANYTAAGFLPNKTSKELKTKEDVGKLFKEQKMLMISYKNRYETGEPWASHFSCDCIDPTTDSVKPHNLGEQMTYGAKVKGKIVEKPHQQFNTYNPQPGSTVRVGKDRGKRTYSHKNRSQIKS